MLDNTFNGRQAGRLGNSCPYACPHGAYRCKGDDRWCAISVYNDEEWRSLCRICGSDWDQDPRFRTLLDRKRNENELNSLVEDWTVKFTAEEVESRMQAGGIAAGVVRNARDLCLDQNLRDEGYLWSLKHPVLGFFPHMGQPARMSKTPATGMLPAPCLGEHTEYVCTQLLGMTDDEFLDLYQTGIFG
jgi:benzylsuccinate CoA-transferase BbsF subunit